MEEKEELIMKCLLVVHTPSSCIPKAQTHSFCTHTVLDVLSHPAGQDAKKKNPHFECLSYVSF